jgi:uncharacterized protein YkwD
MNYSANERSVFEIINNLRQDPQYLIKDLELMLNNFKGVYYKIPNTNINIITAEGAEAVKEAIAFLKTQKPLTPLKSSQGMYLAAQGHCRDIGERGVASHQGKNGSRMCDRLDEFGQWEVSIAENISFDDYDAREIVIGQIIDDGNPSRGHRFNIFNPEFNVVGVACGPHSKFKHCCVINFAVGFNDKFEEDPQEDEKPVTRKKTLFLTESLNKDHLGKVNDVKVNAQAPKMETLHETQNEDDVFFPDGAVGSKVKKYTKIVGNKRIIKTTTYFTMKDGSEEVLEETQVQLI